MFRHLAILLVLPLISLASAVCLAGETPDPPAPARPDTVEVERREYEGPLQPIDRLFLPFAGKIIARIRVLDLEVFGASVEDTTRSKRSRVEGVLNHLNFRTRESTVRRHLLFKEGDAIDPVRLADSERILRTLPFLADARIVVGRRRSRDPAAGDGASAKAHGASADAHGDSAEVLVIVKDTWALELSARVKEGNRLKVSLTEQNVLGLGHALSTSATLAPRGVPGSGLDTDYSVPSIGGSFINGKLSYVNAPAEKSVGLALSRRLVSPLLRYAGGFDLKHSSIVVGDSLPTAADNTSNLVDLWAGKPVHFRSRQREIAPRRILFLSGRVRRVKFTRRPKVTPTTYYQYHDVSNVLGSVALIQSRYYRTNLLYNFNRMEDVPYGFLVRATYGLAAEEFFRSGYASAALAGGGRSDLLGYGVGEVRIGGYLRNHRLDQGVLRFRTLCFSRLQSLGRYRLRHFLKAGYITGIHRSAGESIDFKGDESIRGVVYDEKVRGSKRLQLDLETIAFTPWRPWGVSCAVFSFGDLDFIGSGGRNVLAHRPYSGIGLGVRLRKEAWAVGQLQFRFAWYPRLPVKHPDTQITAFGESRFEPLDFPAVAPEIVEY